MRRLEGAVAVLDYGLRHAVLTRPPELAQRVSHPTDRIADVRILGWIEQGSECLPDGGGTQTFAGWPELAFIVHTIYGLTPSRSGGTSLQNGGPGTPLGGSP